MSDAEHRHHVVEETDGSGRGGAQAIAQIAANIQMRKQQRVLKDHADAAAVRRHEAAALDIEQDLAIDHDTTPIGLEQTGQYRQHRRLAGTRSSEERERLAVAGKAAIEAKAAPVDEGLELDHDSPETRRRTRRASHSEPASATKDSSTETAVRRSAPASPPGVCVAL